jgi:hypothetical protein
LIRNVLAGQSPEIKVLSAEICSSLTLAGHPANVLPDFGGAVPSPPERFTLP